MPFCSDALDGFLLHRVLVNQLLRFLLKQNLPRLLDLHTANLGALGHHVAHHVAQADGAAANLQRRRGLLNLDFQLMLLQLAAQQLLADFIPLAGKLLFLLGGRLLLLFPQQKIKRIAAGLLRRVNKQRHQPVLRQHLRPRLDALYVLVPHHADGVFRQIA